MVPLDRALVKTLYVSISCAVDSYHVAICSGVAAICNEKFLPASIFVETVIAY